MDESEFEARLKRRLHERFDGHRASSELRTSVAATMAAQPSSTRRRMAFDFLFAGSRQLLAAVAVMVVVVIVGIALTGRDNSVGVPSPSPSPAVSPLSSARPGTSPSSPVTSAVPTETLASVPPILTAAWSGLTFQQLKGAPELSMIVPWAGGYVAIAGSSSNGQLGTWLSRDGRAWSQLPAATFGLDDPTHNTFVIGGAACGSGVLMVGEDASGNVTLWFSSDGRAWRQDALPGTLSQVRETFIAGSPAGAVITAESGPAVDVTTDCSTWQRVDLSGPASVQISAVAAFGTGYVALDASSPAPGSQPHAWWSPDGASWSGATVQAARGDDFSAVWAAGSGLLAKSHSGGIPGLETLWSSTDGRAWVKDGAADPFGVRLSGGRRRRPGRGDRRRWEPLPGLRVPGRRRDQAVRVPGLRRRRALDAAGVAGRSTDRPVRRPAGLPDARWRPDQRRRGHLVRGGRHEVGLAGAPGVGRHARCAGTARLNRNAAVVPGLHD